MSRRRQLEEQDWPWSFPRPSHPLPAFLLGNKGASGSWARLVPDSYSSPADVEPGLGSARLLSALGEGTGWGRELRTQPAAPGPPPLGVSA